MNTAVESVAVREPRAVPLVEAPPVAAREVGSGASDSNLRTHLTKGTQRLLGLVGVDLSVILVAGALLRVAREGEFGEGVARLTAATFPAGLISSAQLAVAIVLSFYLLGCYRDGDRWRDPVKILTASAVGCSVAFYSDLWHGSPALVAGRGLLVWVFLGPLLLGARAAAGVASRRFASAGLTHRVLEVTGVAANGRLELGPSYRFVSTVRQEDLPRDISSMERVLAGGVDTIIVRGEVSTDRFIALTDLALTHGCRLLCAPYSAPLSGVDKKRVWVEGHPLIEFTTPGLRASHLVLKRVLDLSVASLTVVLLSPLLAALAIGIKLDSPGPVLFRQTRPGTRGRPFGILKFRSMRIDAEEVLGRDTDLYERFLDNGCKLPDGEDPRITRVGRFLRRSSLDELPQLFNVILGEMSLVGPRPLVGPELENYGERAATLLSVKPGMTGQWQVAGRSSIPFPERAEVDLEYVRNWSFLGDLWILMLTPAAVLKRRGAH